MDTDRGADDREDGLRVAGESLAPQVTVTATPLAMRGELATPTTRSSVATTPAS